MNVEKLVEIYYAVDEFLIKFMPYRKCSINCVKAIKSYKLIK
ncbi:hypothetical protein [Cardinium endosymbiont of Oedothorax gibbosus]|nr:hypothetical protein [Cardinium endosymbiont of Oedothorax gibbosus]